ncbi:MAG: hypothetical protein ABI808_08910 [Pseudonocardiales bacterium]
MSADDQRSGTAWGRVAVIVIGLIIAAMVVSFVLRLLKLVFYIGLLAIGVTVVMRALRGRR